MAKKKAKKASKKATARKAPSKATKKASKRAPKKAPKKPAAKKSAKKARKVRSTKAAPKKKPAAGKTRSKKAPSKKAVPAARKVEKEPKLPKPKKMPIRERRYFKELLHTLRDRVVDEITFLAGDNLNRSQRDSSGDLSSYSYHMADQGTDNFDREFALNLVSSEQDVLYEIDEALRRIELGTYGICEMTGGEIERERLKALPHTRYCLSAQAELEKGKARYRPFGPTIGQSAPRAVTG